MEDQTDTPGAPDISRPAALQATVEPMEPLWRTAELAQHLGVSPATVLRRVRSGDWPSRSPGRGYRFTRADVHTIENLVATGGEA